MAAGNSKVDAPYGRQRLQEDVFLSLEPSSSSSLRYNDCLWSKVQTPPPPQKAPARRRAKPPPSASRLKPAASPRFPAPAAPELGSRRRTWPRILRWEVTRAGHRGFLAARPRVQGHKRRWKEAHAPRRFLALALPGREALRASALGATRSRATRQGQPGARDPELGCEQDAAPRGRLAWVGVPKPRPYLCFMLQCPSALASQWPVRAALSHRPGDRGGV
uniref:uncharacterized protein LOC114670304 n=1 Tax=Macaca mulatta TaxID=9544 RepID=UPI0010A23142|nr:uncharacterized protein LOC114670304 [Macaca mulatta]